MLFNKLKVGDADGKVIGTVRHLGKRKRPVESLEGKQIDEGSSREFEYGAERRLDMEKQCKIFLK